MTFLINTDTVSSMELTSWAGAKQRKIHYQQVIWSTRKWEGEGVCVSVVKIKFKINHQSKLRLWVGIFIIDWKHLVVKL